jgi:hypothetical protein
MACRDCAPASSAEEEPLSPPAATAARARLAVAGGALRHGGTTARERDRDSGLRQRVGTLGSAAAGARRASGFTATGCGEIRRWLGRHLAGRVIAGGMAPAPRAGTRGPERRGGGRVVSSVSRVMPRFMNSDRVGEAKRSFGPRCC